MARASARSGASHSGEHPACDEVTQGRRLCGAPQSPSSSRQVTACSPRHRPRSSPRSAPPRAPSPPSPRWASRSAARRAARARSTPAAPRTPARRAARLPARATPTAARRRRRRTARRGAPARAARAAWSIRSRRCTRTRACSRSRCARRRVSPPGRGTAPVEYTVTDASGARVTGLDVLVEPWMPSMGHGASVKPSVSDEGEGRYVATNVELFVACVACDRLAPRAARPEARRGRGRGRMPAARVDARALRGPHGGARDARGRRDHRRQRALVHEGRARGWLTARGAVARANERVLGPADRAPRAKPAGAAWRGLLFVRGFS